MSFRGSVLRRLALITGAVVLAAVAGAQLEPASAAVATPRALAAAPAVSSLAATGLRTDVTVRGLRTRSQAAWIDRMLDERLVGVEGCAADPGPRTLSRGTYRNHVNLICADGTASARKAAARLAAAKPWYRVRTTTVPVVAFTFLADLPEGNGDAVPAALAKLPRGDFFIAEGDDVSLTYVGQGVTQAQLDAALAAFAGALKVPTAKVAVTPIRWS